TGIPVRWLVMVRVWAPDDSENSFILTNTNGRNQIVRLYGLRPCHVRADRGGIVAGELLVSSLKQRRQLCGVPGHSGIRLVFDTDIRTGALLRPRGHAVM